MPSPSSCVRCSRPLAVVSASGLCPECAATSAASVTADPTPLLSVAPGPDPAATATFGADRASFAPTASLLPPPETASAPADDRAGFPHPPAGYELIRRLGSGGMGVVYLARETASERLVAMKFLRSPGNQEALERFVTELRVLAKLDHPNVVRVFTPEFLRADPFFTMEYLPGGSLARAREGAPPLAPAEAVRLIRTIAGAVAWAHAREVIHRDLKPSNILLAADGTPKVADFGLAKRLDEVDPVTLASGALGTPGYMPPEQISSKNGEVGRWSDVYGLGATLYHLLTGRAPFVGPSPVEIVHQVLADPPARPRALRPDLPAALEGIVLKCLEKEPKDRYQTVAEFLADLDRYEAGQKPVAPPLTPLRRAKLWVRRHRVRVAVGALVAVLIAGAFALGAMYWAEPPAGVLRVEVDPWAEARNELAAGRAAVLVPEKGLPVRHTWRLRPTALGESPLKDDGSCYFEAIDSSVLELMDDPGIDSYTLTLNLMYHGSRPGTTTGQAGLVFGLVDHPDAGGRPLFRHYAVVMKDVTEGGGPASDSKVYVMDVPWNRQSDGLPLPNRSTFGFAEIPVLKQRPGPWRGIKVRVTPDSIRVWWQEKPGAKEELLAELVRADGNQFNQTLIGDPERGVRLRPVPPGWTSRRAIGIWAESASVSFKNVVISPNP